MASPAKSLVSITAGICFYFLISCAPAQSQDLDSLEIKIAENVIASYTPITSIQDTITTNPFVEETKPAIKKLPEYVVVKQIRSLKTTVPMSYNKTIAGFINNFMSRDRQFVALMLQRQQMYFPIFEASLKKHNLPDELKYLTIVESSLNPRAFSSEGAAGLWQFISSTAKYYNLYQDAFIDERMDPYKATEVACLYLKYLHKMFDDWHLALAAYNCGPGGVRKAIRKSGNKKTFWQISPYLSAETRAYVPKFIAVTYAMKYAKAYNIKTLALANHTPMDTILVSSFINTDKLAKQLSISSEEFRIMNPQIKKNVVPGYLKNFCLRIPADKKEYFALNRICILDSASFTQNNKPSIMLASNTDALTTKKKVYHKVRKGEALSQIANKHQVNAKDIKRWNKLKTNTLKAGQVLTIWVYSKPAVKPVQLANHTKQLDSQPQNTIQLTAPLKVETNDSKPTNDVEANLQARDILNTK